MKRLISFLLALGALVFAGCANATTTSQLPSMQGALQVEQAQPIVAVPFQPNSAGNISLAVSNAASTSATALPSTDPTVVVQNTGSGAAYLVLGGSSVSATNTGTYLPAGCTVSLFAGSSGYIAAYGSGSTTLIITTGKGAGLSGCGGAGGSGGAVSAASGAYASGSIAAGAIVDLGTGSSPSANTTNNYLQTLSEPFIPNSAGNSTLSVSNSTARVALPSSDPTVLVYNTGQMDAFIVLGTSSVTATTAGTPVPAGCMVPFYAGANVDLAAITASNTTSLTIVTGKGSAFKTCNTVNFPYATEATRQRGAGSATSTSLTLTNWSAPGSGLFGYITDMECFRTDAGTSMIYVTMNDTASTTLPIPAGGGFTKSFIVPLKTNSSATAPAVTVSTGTTTVYCSAQGYNGN